MTMSFQDFIQLIKSKTQRSPLNQVAYAYWHDYLIGQPIDGGVAFEPMLRKIPLDGSLKSLQILDKFLDKAKPHLADNALLLSQNISQRNLLIFIAFYAGLVLSYHATQPNFANQNGLTATSEWLSLEQLEQRYPPLSRLVERDFSYSLAVSLLPIVENQTPFIPSVVSDTVYFPLVTVIERLFPQRHNAVTNTAPFFGYISNSLFESVNTLLKRWHSLSLDTADILPTIAATETSPVVSTDTLNIDITMPKSLLSDLDNPLMERKDWQAIETLVSQQPVVTHFNFAVPDFSDLSMHETADSEPVGNLIDNSVTTTFNTDLSHTLETSISDENLTNQVTDNSVLTEKVTTSAKKTHQKIDTRQLSSRQAIAEAKKQAKELARQKAEREAQLAKEAEAQRQAEIAEALANPRINEKLLQQRKSMLEERAKIKDSFSELEQDLQTAQLPDSMPDNAKHAYQQALQIIQQSPHQQTDKALAIVAKLAQANSTDAMLHQALWHLRGREDLGIAKNSEQGIALVKTAANLQDSRAEKLLSKLYFSGEIVGMDSEQGKFWLEQAANHGHSEAKRLQQSFMLVNNLKETRQDEDNYLKKLAIGTAVLLLFAIIVIFAIKI